MGINYRLFEHSDIQMYLDWVNQKEIWEVDNSGSFESRTKESFLEQWENIVGWQRSWFIVVDGREIGYIGFVSDENDYLTDEFFIVIGEIDQWGKGYGTRAMEWLFDAAVRLNLSRVTGQVLGSNSRALGFYESLGFRILGEQEPSFQREGKTYRMILIEMTL